MVNKQGFVTCLTMEVALSSSNPFLVGLGFALPFFVLILLYFIIVGIAIICAECQDMRQRRRHRSRDPSFTTESI